MEKQRLSPKELILRHKHDLILVLSLCFIAAVSALLMLALRAPGGEVRVEIDGEYYATYPLSTDGEYPLGDGNVLAIKEGEAYMLSADCPDKTCVRHHPVSYSGESIVCLPNRVTVTVISDESDVDLAS